MVVVRIRVLSLPNDPVLAVNPKHVLTSDSSVKQFNSGFRITCELSYDLSELLSINAWILSDDLKNGIEVRHSDKETPISVSSGDSPGSFGWAWLAERA